MVQFLHPVQTPVSLEAGNRKNIFAFFNGTILSASSGYKYKRPKYLGLLCIL